MKLRKLFAWLMTLVMLLGMVPAGHAEVIACDHHWAWRWPDGQPTNCQDWKCSEEYCTLCGEGNGRFEQCGPCQPGSWHWDGNPPANCNEWGIQNQSCSVCGEVFNEREVRGDHQWGGYTTVEPAGCETPGEEVSHCTVCGERGSSREIPAKGHDWGEWKWEVEATCNKEGLRVRYCKRCNMRDEDYVQGGEHQWGEWITTVEPTCMEQGRHHHTCQRCGATMWEYMPMANHVFGEWRVIEEPQVGIPGTERRACIYGCGTHEDREIPALEEALSAVGLELTLVLSSTPANGTHFGVGEEVVFTETWVNNTDKTLYPFSVSIWTCGTPVFGSEIDQICSWFAEDAGGPVAPGASGSHTLTVTVTEADVARGAIYAMAELLSTVQDGPDLENVTTPFVTAPCGPVELPDADDPDSMPAAGLTVDMTYTNTPANGTFFTPGEVIDYLITVTNPGSITLTNLQVGNSSSEAVVPAPSEIAPGQTIQVPYYKLVYEGDAKAGGINSYGHANAFNGDPALPESLVSGRSTDVFVPCGMGDGTPSVYYLKTVANAPANGLYFTEGETIKYRLSFGNNTKKDIYNITLNDPMANTRSVAFARRLKAGEFLMGEFEYVVTAADVAAGEIVNTATSTWATKAEGAQTKTPSNTVVTPTGDESILQPGDPAANEVSLTKQIVNAPANGAYFVPGEEIVFDIAVHNNSTKTLDVVVLTDPLAADFYHELLDIPGGAMDSRTLRYTVTEFDAEIGSVINYAYAVAYVDDQPMSLTSNSVTAPCGFPGNDGDGNPDEPFGIHTALEVVKSVESLPLNGSYYQEGETVAYKITYVNTGEIALTDVMIYDALGGMSEIATAETLQPGESRVCWYNHTVTKADVLMGFISNTAIGQFELGGYLNTVSSNTVVVDTDGKNDDWIKLPPWDLGDQPSYTPDIGWTDIYYPSPDTEDTPEDSLPPFGTIDTDQLHSGAASCARTITGRGNASVGYELSFCADHVDTQSSVLLMMQAANTPEMQLQTAAYAVVLWRGEVEALYQKIIAAADSAAKATVMTEYIRFLTEVANYEALLKNLYPDQPALAAKKIAAMWEDKCVTLCCEMHASAAQRKDSLLSVTPVNGAASTECSCVTAAEENGKKAYTQSWCPVHGFPFSMIDMLLQGQDTAQAWTMVRQIWGVELTNAYNKLAVKLGANNGLAMAEYNALTQWMMAREASLIALYPEHPEVVAQTMVKVIMDRVNDLCQVTK